MLNHSYPLSAMRGDQIYVMRPLAGLDSLYQHHGIDCGDRTVIHYYKPSDAIISRTSWETFARGNPIFTQPYTTCFVPDVVIERAESRLGERQYNLLTNNCEHFATWCKVGKSECLQLAGYGLDAAKVAQFDPRLVEEAMQGNPVQAMQQFGQALDNVAIAQSSLQSQIAQAQKEMDTWQRAAQLALQQGKEPLARAALERKVPLKKQVEAWQKQLREVAELQQTIERDRQQLQRYIVTE